MNILYQKEFGLSTAVILPKPPDNRAAHYLHEERHTDYPRIHIERNFLVVVLHAFIFTWEELRLEKQASCHAYRESSRYLQSLH